MEAVKEYGSALEFVKIQTDEICLMAVKNNGLVLDIVENQTYEICQEAVKSNGLDALNCIKNQDFRLRLLINKMQPNE